ncbi:uncharacterized protein VDAG_08917 [Verticillium dahliae VdLs.17]|uniref:Uncharacterized protein n=1 Tax=Verticillium dahliae (strain VdLs.17 / ATCC MYA-4575 / FGSC 10137) TaxID=498257 RepID=G2XGD0_VERDV|nr:uncharacterized protein VDAG_08917 [Verticillium dahliae VdLs.17]EGY18757.1 hypothetical protein VDAG_08917 [Verticillium dahliae VdLs.17]
MASSVRLVGHMHSRTPSDLTKPPDPSRRGPRQNPHSGASEAPEKPKHDGDMATMKDTHLRTNHHSQKSGQGIVRTPCAHGTWPPVFTPSPDCATADVKTRDSLETSKEQAPLPCPKPVHDTMKSRVPKLRAVDVGSSVGRQHEGVAAEVPVMLRGGRADPTRTPASRSQRREDSRHDGMQRWRHMVERHRKTGVDELVLRKQKLMHRSIVMPLARKSRRTGECGG